MTNTEKVYVLLSNARYLVSGVEFSALLPLTGLKVVELARLLAELIDSGRVEIHETSRSSHTYYGREAFVITYRIQ